MCIKKKIIEKFKSFNFSIGTKTLFSSLCLFTALYLVLVWFQLQQENLYILEFIINRLNFLLILFLLFEMLEMSSFIENFRIEMEVLNKGPKNKSKFLVFLRNWHNTFFVLMFISYSLATTYYINDILISYITGILSFVFASLYSYQFIVYTNAYFQKSQLRKCGNQTNRRTIWTSASTITFQKAAVICYECSKGVVTMCFAGEAFYKLTHGGLNDVSPVRQALLNRQFPDDKTKIWTETKAALSTHNRAFGNPHDYGFQDQAQSVLDKLNEKKN